MEKSDKVNAIACTKLDKMRACTTELACAIPLAGHITVELDVIRWTVTPEPHTVPFHKELACTSLSAVAEALDLSPTELARRVDLDGLGKSLMIVAALSADVDVRTILVAR